MLSSPYVVAESELLMAIPSYVADHLNEVKEVKTFKLPFSAPPFTVKIYSHKRSGKKKSTDWLKGYILKSISKSALASKISA